MTLSFTAHGLPAQSSNSGNAIATGWRTADASHLYVMCCGSEADLGTLAIRVCGKVV